MQQVDTSQSGLRPGSPRAGFSLMELLVVISIIALLLGIIVPTYNHAIELAKRTRAKVKAKNLETAFRTYLDQYRKWPDLVKDGENHEIKDILFKMLRGDEDACDPGNNPDVIVFYDFASTNPKAGALDPWSNPADDTTWKPYRVRVDEDYDGKIDQIRSPVIVWSVGTNRTDGVDAEPTKEGNIRSWD